MKPLYLSMSHNAPTRLASLRRAATKKPGATWREVRQYGFHNWEANYCTLSQGFDTRGKRSVPIWYCHTGAQFRGEQYADQCEGVRIGHTGWFSDNDSGETVRGIVARLTHGRFISGYEWSSNGERIYFSDVFDDISEAARNADREAEMYAEACREDDAKYQEARRLEDENETALHRLRECIALRHVKCMAYARDEIAELVEKIRGNRDRLQTEFAGYL